MKAHTHFTPAILLLLFSQTLFGQSAGPSGKLNEVVFHTEDIENFWTAFDKTYPILDAAVFQTGYIDIGSKGLKGFIRGRIENGDHLAKTVKDNLAYYQAIRASSLSIANKKDRFYECFENLQKIYPAAVFPDVYFVIGAKNSGGTTFSKGLIIGAEMFGKDTNGIKPALDIDLVDELVSHELIHFQQRNTRDNSLLAQCIMEGSADFICELIAGGHSNSEIFAYGDAHVKELWDEFQKDMNGTDWKTWLYTSKDKSRPKDLGYWMGYKITKSYYNNTQNKSEAITNILHIRDYRKFLADSKYNGE
jgi:hypothetical protein